MRIAILYKVLSSLESDTNKNRITALSQIREPVDPRTIR